MNIGKLNLFTELRANDIGAQQNANIKSQSDGELPALHSEIPWPCRLAHKLLNVAVRLDRSETSHYSWHGGSILCIDIERYLDFASSFRAEYAAQFA